MLYVNTFTLFPLYFRSAEKLETNNWIVKGFSPELQMEYMAYFGCSTNNDSVIAKLKTDCEMVWYGTVKTSRNGSLLLRIKQLICED